mgnify:CR=1 FL=1
MRNGMKSRKMKRNSKTATPTLHVIWICTASVLCTCFKYLKNIFKKSENEKDFRIPYKKPRIKKLRIRHFTQPAAVPKIKTFCQSDNGQHGQMNTVHQKSKKPFSFTNYDCLWGLTTSRVLPQPQTLLSLPMYNQKESILLFRERRKRQIRAQAVIGHTLLLEPLHLPIFADICHIWC